MTTTIRDLSLITTNEENKLRRQTIEAVDRGVGEVNLAFRADADGQSLIIAVSDAAQQVVGGLLGKSRYGWLHIDLLWVRASIRGQGYGRQLMERAETIAVERGCHSAHLETYTFQAPGFYRKLGYEIFGELVDYPGDNTQYYLKKRLVSPAVGRESELR